MAPMPEPELRPLRLFDGLSQTTRGALAADVDRQTFAPGDTLVIRGDTSSDVYLVLSGYLMGLMVSDTGREVAVADFGPGTLFGEMAAIDAEPRSLTIQAVTSGVTGRVAGRDFNRWLDAHTVIPRNLLKMMADRTRQMNEAVFGLVVHRVEMRVRLMLIRLFLEQRQLRQGGVLDPAPSHSMIAAHVGANREAVSRVLSRLVRGGVIKTGRRRITLLEPEALRTGL